MNTEELLKLKKLLDEGIITQEEFEKQKADILKREKTKKNKKTAGIIVSAVLVFIFIVALANTQDNSAPDINATETQQVQNSVPEVKVPEEFASELPISVSGSMEDDILGFPQLSLNVENKTDKDILALKVYFHPIDVYGEDVKGIFASNRLETDNVIVSGSSTTLYWQMLDNDVKGGDVYIYSIYFADGTEWGNRDAAVSDIRKYGYKLSVKY